MPPQAAFKAALARSRQREMHYHPYPSTRPMQPFQTKSTSRLKREPPTEDDLIVLDSVVVNDTKPNSSRKNYSGGKGVADAIELSDDDSTPSKTDFRMLTAKQARRLAERPSKPDASCKEGEGRVEKDLGGTTNSALPSDYDSKEQGPQEKTTEELNANADASPDVDQVPEQHVDTTNGQMQLGIPPTEPSKTSTLQSSPLETVPNDTVEASVKDAMDIPRDNGSVEGLASSGPEIPNDGTVSVDRRTSSRVHDGNTVGVSPNIEAGEVHELHNAHESYQVAPTAYMGPPPCADVGTTPNQESLIPSDRERAVNVTARDGEADTPAPEAAEEMRLAKARDTLSQMKKTLRESRRREQDITSQPINAGTRNVPKCNAHSGPSGLRIGLASLGLGDANILQPDEPIEEEDDIQDEPEHYQRPKPPLSKYHKRDKLRDTLRQLGVTSKDKRTCKELPKWLEDISDIDWMILQMKIVNHYNYNDVCNRYKAMTGQETSVKAMTNRLNRLKAKLLECATEQAGDDPQASRRESSAADLFIRDSATPPLSETYLNSLVRDQRAAANFHRSTGKRPRDGPAITEWFQASKNQSVERGRPYHKNITLEEGYFERHKQRIEALKARAEWESRPREEYFDGQEQSLFLSSDSEGDDEAPAHPTTAGKGLSMETLRKWKADARAYPTPSQSDVANEELETPTLLYEYQVSNRVQLAGESDSHARTIVFGPYYTLAEANAIAAKKARLPDLDYGNIIFRPGAWSYSYDKDDTGMETHVYTGKMGTITTWVSRSIAPPEEKIGIPLKAFTTPAWMYIAMASSRNESATEHAYVTDDNEVITLDETPPRNTIIKACTLLDIANRAAGDKWLELRINELPKNGLEGLRKAEIKMHIRLDLEELEKKHHSFDRTYRDPKSGLETHIWVERAEVEGPRN